MNNHNLSKLQELSETLGIDVVVIQAPDNIEYFTGVPSIGDLSALLIYKRRDNLVELYVPLLEYYRYRASLPEHVSVYGVSRALKPSDAQVVSLDWKDIVLKATEGYEKVGADTSHSGSLQATVINVLGSRAVGISDKIWDLRSVKSDAEIAAIEKAAKVTLKGILAIIPELREGVSESELAGVFESTVRKHGVDELAFNPIVAFKPNNAFPHTLPGSRKLGSNDLVLIDVGVKMERRCSDITRMIVWGRPSSEEKRALEALVEAVNAALDYIKPGIKAGEVYEAAARVLEKYGFKERFIHGLGHGIGIVVHEPPYLRQGSEKVLVENMVLTIEPGVYIPGSFGVRVEEDVVVTKSGARVLSKGVELILEVL